MKIGFYGHSSCAYRGPTSYIDILAKELDAEIVNTGAAEGSEERILVELKRTPALDLAIIFHSKPSFLFLPNVDRDIKIGKTPENRVHYLMKTKFGVVPNIKEEFETVEKFFEVMNVYLKHFHNHDLMLNRFYGALIQIDQYVTHKKIPCIHVLQRESSLPSWFKFSSGIIDTTAETIINNYPKQYGEFSPNTTTELGNKKLAEHFKNLITEIGRS